MRLHTLEMTAFGPFPDTATIDFDALSGSGLFLLAGPTGAGKSSVLDAVCFALYGDVPGDRSSAKRLRCDTAPEGVPPRVVLEATLFGRRFRIERSPAWTRPKRRGTGTTTEQARVVLSEHVDGAWVARSRRLDETGHLVTQLVGMNLPQFCQVALLPQGRFQAFLRARSEERHALLQQVFRTGRFDQVEKWLRERRTHLRRSSESHEEGVADLVSRLSEVAGHAPPESWTLDPGVLAGWAQERLTAASLVVTAAAATAARARVCLVDAESAHDEGVRVDDLASRGDRARHEQSALGAAAPGVEIARTRLQAGRRAETVAPLLRLADDATQAAEEAHRAQLGHRRRVLEILGKRCAAEDDAHIDAQVGRAVRAWQDIEPAILDLPVSKAARDGAATSAAAARSRVEGLTHRRASLPAEIESGRAALDQAREGRLEASRLLSVVADLEARAAARARSAALRGELSAAQAEVDAVHVALMSAKEDWLAVREARLDGMAAEIATGLAVGACCPVCGSLDHPSPAPVTHGAPDAQAERRARATVDDLEVVLEAHRQLVRDLETRLATEAAVAGDEADDLETAVTAARAELDEATAWAQSLPSLEAAQAALEAEDRDLSLQLADARVELGEHEHALAQAQSRLDVARASIDEMLTLWEAPDADHLGASITALRVAHEHWHGATARAQAAEQARADSVAAAGNEARAAGFEDRADAADAVLSSEEALTLQTTVQAHDAEATRVATILEDPAVLAALETTPRPDITRLATALSLARDEAAAADRAHDRASSALERMQLLADALDRALTSWEPVRAELTLAASLASFVEGKSADNRLQMRLSAYVLAHRLSQVVEAANLRLWAMSSQRYALVHTGHKGAGETRGGLSLLVRDEWSGETRDPATLSGGESFVVSLALALGLADVIGHEVGGAELHTLFVDEGFGALDADTLDDVMDVLDELRDGGRVVGVVSHVPELRTRIPTQLRVNKGREGSSVSLRVG